MIEIEFKVLLAKYENTTHDRQDETSICLIDEFYRKKIDTQKQRHKIELNENENAIWSVNLKYYSN